MLNIDQAFRDHYRQVLLNTYMKGWSKDYCATPAFESDVRALTEDRYFHFSRNIVPWIKRARSLGDCTALEIGSGTGSSTLAMATEVAHIHAFEIDPSSIAAARERLRYFGVRNVDFHEEQFDSQSALVREGYRVDLVLLFAVLEHLTYPELRSVLETSWKSLNSGGLLVVVDTPNRLACMDLHTSLLPFFHQLPPEVRLDYAAFSPRDGFAASLAAAATPDAARTSLSRWGAGVSYHEFELVLGQEVHHWVTCDGYEPEMTQIAPVGFDDLLLQLLFKHLNLQKHQCFTRSNLHFILRKPG